MHERGEPHENCHLRWQCPLPGADLADRIGLHFPEQAGHFSVCLRAGHSAAGGCPANGRLRYLYIGYPNQFYSKTELIERYKYSNNSELQEFIENNNLNDLLIEYANLSSEIINNKIDNTYSICDFYKNNVILYNLDNKGYKPNLNCN